MTIDVPLLRSDTPGVANVLHFNNAGAALPPRPVVEAVTSHLAREAAIGGYETAAEAADRIADVYDAIATLIGAHWDEIAFVESATRAWDMAFYAVAFRAGDRVVTARAEYLSNISRSLQMRDEGARRDPEPRGRQRRVGAARRRRDRARDRSAHKADRDRPVPTEGGLVNPAAEVGRIAARARARSARARIGRARPRERALLQRRVRVGALRSGSGGVASLGKSSFGLVALEPWVRYLIAGHL